MEKPALFGGKLVILVAPGPQSAKLEVDPAKFDVIAAAGDFWRMSRLMVPRVIPRIDVAYTGPSFVARACEYGWPLPEKTVFKTSFEHPYYDPACVQNHFEDYNFPFEKTCNRVGCNLTTGMAAILDILAEHPAQLYLHGFTFYKSETPYIKGYASNFDARIITATKGNISGHNQETLLRHFLSLDHSVIQLDSYAKSLL